MASDPRIRASDADRDRTAALLREHHAAGRLTAEEFNERLEKAYAAKTLGDLDELLADLPGIDLYKLPDASLHRDPRGGSGPPPLPCDYWVHGCHVLEYVCDTPVCAAITWPPGTAFKD